MKSKIYYHFTGDKLRDGRPIPTVGEWLVHEGPIEMCVSGLHASEHPFDALQYAPGEYLHKVELDGVTITERDKVVARERKIIATIDATKLLRKFARKQALSVIDKWDAPKVVIEYLKTGDEKLIEKAYSAASSAADSAASAADSAARSAARSAAYSAASSAADSAASAASATYLTARSAADSAAWAAASAARSAASATYLTARSAAYSAARLAASAARLADWSAARKMLAEMVDKAFEK
jgi:hypothetical protein